MEKPRLEGGGEETCPPSPKRLKNGTMQVMLVSVSLPHTYGLGVLDEDLGAPHLVLVRLHVDCPQQVLDPLTLVPAPIRPCFGGQNGVPKTGAGEGLSGWWGCGECGAPGVGEWAGRLEWAGGGRGHWSGPAGGARGG